MCITFGNTRSHSRNGHPIRSIKLSVFVTISPDHPYFKHNISCLNASLSKNSFSTENFHHCLLNSLSFPIGGKCRYRRPKCNVFNRIKSLWRYLYARTSNTTQTSIIFFTTRKIQFLLSTIKYFLVSHSDQT